MNYMKNCYICGKFRKVKAEIQITVKEEPLNKIYDKEEICEKCLHELRYGLNWGREERKLGLK